MSILEISILGAAALIIGRIPRPQIRTHLLLLSSIFVVYWLQSRSIEIYSITYWLPTLTVVLVTFSWALTASPEIRGLRTNWPGLLVIVVAVLVIDLTRFLGKTNPVFPNVDFPDPLSVFLVIALVFLLAFISTRIAFLKRFNLPVTILIILAAFLVIKLPALDKILYKIISKVTGSPQNIKDTFVWLGFSYFAFRIR